MRSGGVLSSCRSILVVRSQAALRVHVHEVRSQEAGLVPHTTAQYASDLARVSFETHSPSKPRL